MKKLLIALILILSILSIKAYNVNTAELTQETDDSNTNDISEDNDNEEDSNTLAIKTPSSTTSTQQSGRKLTIDRKADGKQLTATTSAGLVIDVKSQGLPRFSVTSNGTTHFVSFEKVFQIASKDEVKPIGGTNVALASVNWVIGNFVERDNGTRCDFNLTGQTGGWKITFGNHVSNDKKEFKFDVVINNFASQWNNAAKFLVLEYKSSAANGVVKGDRVTVGDNGYFSIVPTANGGKVSVEFSNVTRGDVISLIYSKFDNDLVHDPTLGFTTSSASIVQKSMVLLVVCAIFALVF